jgi:hypothetical protein
MRERQPILMKAFITIVLSCVFAGSLLGANPPGTGQPGVECEDIHPGQSSSARGSAFNEDGVAGTVYARAGRKLKKPEISQSVRRGLFSAREPNSEIPQQNTRYW